MTAKSVTYSSRLATRSPGMPMILLPLPLPSCGRSATLNISRRPSVVTAASQFCSRSATGRGLITLAPLGRLSKALPALFLACKSSPLTTKP
ncbi:hypothetical protein D9M73_245350 [compost metagenome]